MALKWAWHFDDESPTVLQDYGFAFQNTSTATNDRTTTAGEVWSYAAFPGTRYGWAISGANYTRFPPSVLPGSQGAIAIPYRSDGTTGDPNANRMINILFLGSIAGSPNVWVSPPTSGANSLRLNMSGGVGGAVSNDTSPLDLTTWHYYAVKFDLSGATWSASLWIDGVQRASVSQGSQTQTAAVTNMECRGLSSAGKVNFLGQVMIFDSASDASEVSRYVMPFDGTTDNVADIVGFPTLVGGASYNAVLDSPLNTASYAEEATPTTGDRTSITGGTIASQMGITPPSIDAVVVHTVSVGEAIQAHAQVGDGTGVTDGASTTISAAVPTYAYVTAPTRPSGGAWTGADTPELNYEID